MGIVGTRKLKNEDLMGEEKTDERNHQKLP